MGEQGTNRMGAAWGSRCRTAITAGLLATTLAATPAAALIKVATYTGTVSEGYDTTGEFFAPGTLLTGKSLVTQYVYDTSVGARSIYPYFSDEVIGGGANGGYYGIKDPLLSSTVTIDGVTRSIDSSNYEGYALVSGGGASAAEAASDIFSGANRYHENSAMSYVDQNNGGIPTSLDINFSIISPSHSSQVIRFYDANPTTGIYTHEAYAVADASTITVTDVVTSAVPEPANWVLMIGGFCAVGTAARRRVALR